MFQYYVLLFFLVHYVESNVSFTCDKKEVAISYLKVAVEMIERAKSNIPTWSDTNCNPVDCADILHMGKTKSGVYTIWPNNRLTEGRPLDIYCDMDTDGGGWTVIQRRGNFGRPNDYFFKDWESYKVGFGEIKKDFWLGNDNIFALTNQKLYCARFDLQDVEFNKKYAMYDSFWIDDVFNNYNLHIADYRGTAGDSISIYHNNNKFSTKDVDNDNNEDENCALKYKGAWWYNSCHHSNLNGIYLHNIGSSGVVWNTINKNKESLRWTEIKIRPKNFVVA